MPKESVYLTLREIDGKHGAKELKRELDKYPGVISVSVNPEKDYLAVDFDNTGVKSEQITNRVIKLGYQIERQENENHIMYEDVAMSAENKPKNTKNNKKSDGKFKSKHINHDPQSESARAKFGLQNTASDDDRKAVE